MSSLQEAPNEVYDLYLETASNIIMHVGDNSAQGNMLRELTNLVRTSCMLDLKLKQSCEILNRLSATQESNDENEGTLDNRETLEQFKHEIAGINTDVSRNNKFLDFEQQVKVFLDDLRPKDKDDDTNDELVLTQNQINVIDPITKKRITDPVRNTACGHVYDRASVTALLETNKNTRCPVIGCPHKDYILLDNLATDIVTKHFLDRNPE